MSLELKIVVQDDGTAVIKGFRDAVVDAMKKSEQAADKSNKKHQEHSMTIGDLLKKIKAIRAEYLAYAGAIGIVTGAITKTAKEIMSLATQTAEYRDSMKDMSTATGISISNLAGLKYAAEEAGSSFEGMVTGVRVLYRTMYDATTGLKEAEDKFKRLGISVTDSNGNLRDGMEVMMEVADKMKGMTNATERAATAQEIFGRSGMELVPVLSEGSDAIKEAITQAEKLGLTFSTTEGIMADKFNTTMNDLKRSISGLKMQFGEELIGPLTTLASSLTVIISQVREFIDSAGGFSNAIDMMIPVWLRAPQGKPGASSKDLFEMSAMLDEAMKGKPSPGPVGGGGTGGTGGVLSSVPPNFLDVTQEQYSKMNADQVKKYYEEINKYTAEHFQQQDDYRKQVRESYKKQTEELEKNVQDQKKLEEERLKDQKEKYQESEETFNEYLEKMRNRQLEHNAQIIANENEANEEKAKSDAEYQKVRVESIQMAQEIIYNLQVAFAGKSKQAAALIKTLEYALTMISAYKAAQDAYEAVMSWGKWAGPLAIPMAVAAGASSLAAGIARAEKINSVSFQYGGVLAAGPRASGTNEVLYKGTPGEGIISRKGMDAIGPEGLDEINRGRKFNRNISVNVNARTFDEDFVRKNLMPMIRRMEKRERA